MRVGIILLAITTSILVLPATDGAVKGTSKLRTEKGSKNLNKYSKNANASALDDDFDADGKDADGKSADTLSTDGSTDEERGLFSWMFFQGLNPKKALERTESTVKLRRNRVSPPLRFEDAGNGKVWIISENKYQAKLARIRAEKGTKT
ncbi:hypothetical protein PHYPSEUDO_009643 [Phytophthora pseudosyringae]|uniref:RxLR effector protein n=1 Tax=Phytophthora pseudosyringae TaxID=221518 RepID=A0A8T1WNZ1_9STRA|nr:hypothetical protein PHYPSEUDO_009643 [Phytophthora pseudosyringae]